MQSLWSMINSLQLVLHLTAFNVNMPANVKNYMSELIKITQVKLIPEEYLPLMYIWKYGSDDDPLAQFLQ